MKAIGVCVVGLEPRGYWVAARFAFMGRPWIFLPLTCQSAVVASAPDENSARAHFRFRQNRPGRICPRNWSAWAWRSFPPAAPRRCSARRESRPKTSRSCTGFPEMLDGRVKTLHPKVHGGLLYVRDNPEHVAQAEAHGIQPIDLVVVNLYPFEKTVAKPGTTLEEAIEQIDIGGPSMLRSAAKNYRSVTVVVDPADYADGAGSDARQRRRDDPEAARAARHQGLRHHLEVRRARSPISSTRSRKPPDRFPSRMPLVARLRYGENPHQTGALYGSFDEHFEKLHGKELSYNNILDITAASELIEEFAEPTVAILKHTNPCGIGSGRRSARGVGQGVRHGQAGAVRRHHHLQPPAHRAARPRDPRDFQRGDHRPGFRAGCARAAAEEEEPAADEEAPGARARPRRRKTSCCARVIGGVLVQSRDVSSELEGDLADKVVTEAQADARRSSRPCSSPGAS